VGDKGMKQLAQDSSVKGDLIVELYTYHEGYNKFTIYIPDKVFKIADAKLLGDNSAQYWHVFNLVYNTNTKQYEVVAVNQTTQDDTQVAKNTPNSGFTAGGYMQLKNSGDASKFFWDGSKITTLNFGDIVAVFETRNNIEQHHITILNNNTKLTPATNNCQFLEPTENNPQPTNVLNCKNLFAANLNFANEYDIADLYQTEEGEVASFKDRLVYFNHTKVDNSLYRYIIKFMKLVDEDAEEYEYVPAKIKGDVLQDQNDQRQFLVYLGGGDSQNKFMLNIGYPLILDKTDYSNIGEEATELYLFNVKRDANSVYVKIVNKFLPPNQNYQVFD
jgi:hypothetical protein